MRAVLCIVLLLSLLYYILASTEDDIIVPFKSKPIDNYLKKGKCKGIWRADKLSGRCFGLELHSTYEELKHIKSVNTSIVCRTLCCNLGDKCVSWQYEKVSKSCKLGKPVRLGMEHADTPYWCEPFAPSKWSGKKLISRS